MTHSDWLQTIAEIGIGFAGFSALIAGMRRREDPASLENSGRSRAVVETSLSVLFSAFLPFLLHGLGVSENSAFRISGALFLAVGAPMTLRGFRRARTAARHVESQMHPVMAALSIGAGLASLCLALACAIGVPATSIPTYYVGALTGTLGIAAINFTGFVFAIDDEPSLPD